MYTVQPISPAQYPPTTLHASVISGRSAALDDAAPHLTVPVLSIAQHPPVCHLFPLGSTSLPQSPSSVPSFRAAMPTAGLIRCHEFDIPRPQFAYNSLSSSITMLTAQAPPSKEIHLSVAALELWETAMNCMLGNLFASRRSSRKFFSATFFGVSIARAYNGWETYKGSQYFAGTTQRQNVCREVAAVVLAHWELFHL